MLRTEWCMEMRTDINHKTKWRFHCATPFRVFGMVPQAVPEIKIGQRSVLIICFCSPPFTYEGIYPLFKLEDALICRICTPRSVFRLSWIRTLMSSFEAQCQIWQVHNTIKHLYMFPASGSHMFFFGKHLYMFCFDQRRDFMAPLFWMIWTIVVSRRHSACAASDLDDGDYVFSLPKYPMLSGMWLEIVAFRCRIGKYPSSPAT